jgi:hypothetical protein
MAIIGISIYEAGDGYFLSGNSFQGKHEALIIFLGSLIGASLFTPQIKIIWASILPQLHPAQILGGMLILGMIGVNESAGWNQIGPKSVVVHVIGGVLIAQPNMVYSIL